MSTYKIIADKLYVVRDQRTRTINFEGLLELRAMFYANNVSRLHPSPTSFISAAQGQMIQLNVDITTVQNLKTVPIRVELWELEPGGGQGGTDYGSMTGNINLLGDSSVIKTDLTVTLSADNAKERSGTIVVTFAAIKQ